MFYSYDTRMLGVSGSYIATFYLPTDFSSRGRFGILRSMNFEHYTYPAICVVTTQEYTSNLVLDRRHATASQRQPRAACVTIQAPFTAGSPWHDHNPIAVCLLRGNSFVAGLPP